MNHNWTWSILSWNIRGINSQQKWDPVRNKILESGVAFVCLQETKRSSFDSSYISKFSPRHLNKFAFSPSTGASRGILVLWNGSLFNGEIIQINSFAYTMKFKSSVSGAIFHLTNVYGPSAPAEKAAFTFWLYNFDHSPFEDWVLVGDFNFIRYPNDRNKPGGSANDMLLFNDIIQHLDLVDIPIEGRQYTWRNMQEDPLLEKLD